MDRRELLAFGVAVLAGAAVVGIGELWSSPLTKHAPMMLNGQEPDEALDQHDQVAEVLCMLGDVRRQQQRHDQAERAYRRALDLRPGMPHALLSLAALEWSHGNAERARGLMERAFERQRLELRDLPRSDQERRRARDLPRSDCQRCRLAGERLCALECGADW